MSFEPQTESEFVNNDSSNHATINMEERINLEIQERMKLERSGMEERLQREIFLTLEKMSIIAKPLENVKEI